MTALRIEGYVIVSADGMLADARNVMPHELKFEGDKAFFTAALDRADLILHGRNSYEDQPNSPRRKRLILTGKVAATAPDPSNPNATLWNPAGASFEAACARAFALAGRTPERFELRPFGLPRRRLPLLSLLRNALAPGTYALWWPSWTAPGLRGAEDFGVDGD